jgi:uncharacterized RDD family membrane protein YckC
VWEALRVTPPGHEREPARLRERFLAGLIDSGSAVGLLGGGAVAVLEAWRPQALERFRGLTRAAERWAEWLNSPRGQGANAVASVLSTAGMRNTRTPGMRVMHIRRVDARTGGPVTLRSAVRRAAFQQAWSAGARRVTRPRFDRWKARAEATGSAQGRGLDPGCCGAVLALWTLQELPVALTSRRQNLFDWVAGTMVARD